MLYDEVLENITNHTQTHRQVRVVKTMEILAPTKIRSFLWRANTRLPTLLIKTPIKKYSCIFFFCRIWIGVGWRIYSLMAPMQKRAGSQYVRQKMVISPHGSLKVWINLPRPCCQNAAVLRAYGAIGMRSSRMVPLDHHKSRFSLLMICLSTSIRLKQISTTTNSNSYS